LPLSAKHLRASREYALGELLATPRGKALILRRAAR